MKLSNNDETINKKTKNKKQSPYTLGGLLGKELIRIKSKAMPNQTIQLFWSHVISVQSKVRIKSKMSLTNINLIR